MFNPQFMSAAIGNQPSVKELWKEEKYKYRHWILLFGIGILVVLSLYLSSFIINQLAKNQVISELEIFFSTKDNIDSNQAAQELWRTKYLLIPIIRMSIVFIGFVYYVVTIIVSYQKKSFAKISQWPTFVIGFGAILSFYQLFSMVWNGTAATFETPGGIFEFINHFITIAVYFSSSIKVSKIRKIFQLAEMSEKMKNDPQYQMMLKQTQQMMQGQGINPTSPFGPTNIEKNTKSTDLNKQKEPKSETPENEEEKSLEKMSTWELQEVAKKLSISGYLNMRKTELIKAILRVTSQK